MFAALDVLEGKIIGQCMQRHHHQEFIRFLNGIEAKMPVGEVVHVILDNYATRKHPKAMAWLMHYPCFVFYFTPTSCSWLNAIESFFAKLTKRFLGEHNDDPKPFVWTADPDRSIVAVNRRHQVVELMR